MSRQAGKQPVVKKPVRPMRKPVKRTPAWLPAAGTVGGIALLVAGFFAIRWVTTPVPPAPLDANSTTVVLSAITSLPASEFDQVGLGTASNRLKRISGNTLTGPTGKPVVFYFGAEYCPYCAAQRWPAIIALSRFGTFSGLQTTSSSSTDVYPDTPTFTFRSAAFSSQFIEFQSVESTDRDQNALQSPTSAQQALISSYDSGGSIPFMDFGNRYAFSGATYLPDVLSGMTWKAVADALQLPDSAQSKAIIGSANLLTAAICKITSDQPSTVCAGTAIQAIEGRLGG